jgi:hypothetical protein
MSMLSQHKLLAGAGGALLLVAGFFLYTHFAFPAVRCEAAKHLDVPEKYADCVTCHAKTTAQIAQDWNDSKHGVTLVKCVVCHGQPDGKGSIPFMAQPDPNVICVRCHEPSMQRMVAKYGEQLDCNTCHPHHQSPMHRKAYEAKVPSKKTSL